MRAANALHLCGILLVAVSLCSFLFAVIDSDGGDSVRGILLFGTPLFPGMMGLVLIVAGYAAGLISRSTWKSPQLA
jgi:hypothetical protein